MARERLVNWAGDYKKTFLSEGGKNYRKEHQDIAPAMKRVQHMRDVQGAATRASNPNQWRHLGSIPMTMLVDWLTKNHYTMDQWARNDGGIPGKQYPASKNGVKDKFLAHFMTREYSKLHNMHTTTKREPKQIVVPTNYIGSKDGTDKLRRVKDGGS